MQLIAYLVAYPFIWFISILPFGVLYFLSDVTYVILYRTIGYRKQTVRQNLLLALPHLSEDERKKIEKRFYHHFCDTFFEMAKTMSLTDKQIEKRFTFTNFDVVHDYEDKNKSIVVLCGHYGNYEWLLSMNKYLKSSKGFGVYKTIRNKHFNELVKKIRRKFRSELVGTKSIIPLMRQNQRQGIQAAYGFLSDQSPKQQSIIYWGKFFDVEVPLQVGGEVLAKKLDMNVIFAKMKKTKRGHYSCTFVPYEGEPKSTPNFEITDWFINLLENHIKEAPEYYLWTHKRFKHRRETLSATA